ncbi:phage holin family protein [Bacillus spizizenii]|nr:phage holin family protein [Bacillus spizizenii]MCY9355627.1 phage holin family protein [Bacillus spizizenii]MCY9361784.1 phage holin family protein [Bacillus spizizenii]
MGIIVDPTTQGIFDSE